MFPLDKLLPTKLLIEQLNFSLAFQQFQFGQLSDALAQLLFGVSLVWYVLLPRSYVTDTVLLGLFEILVERSVHYLFFGC